jgi:hypothetical protein
MRLLTPRHVAWPKAVASWWSVAHPGAFRSTTSPEVRSSATSLCSKRILATEPDVVAAAERTSLVEWAKRALQQSEIASARELAGLTDAELMHLENEFSGCRTRPRPPWQRDAMASGIAFLLLGGCAFAAPGISFGSATSMPSWCGSPAPRWC